jgi:hypothetical protein
MKKMLLCPRCTYPMEGLVCKCCGYVVQIKLEDKKAPKKRTVN